MDFVYSYRECSFLGVTDVLMPLDYRVVLCIQHLAWRFPTNKDSYKHSIAAFGANEYGSNTVMFVAARIPHTRLQW